MKENIKSEELGGCTKGNARSDGSFVESVSHFMSAKTCYSSEMLHHLNTRNENKSGACHFGGFGPRKSGMESFEAHLNVYDSDETDEHSVEVKMEGYSDKKLRGLEIVKKCINEVCYRFSGKYSQIRSTLDYKHHTNYALDRQLLQDDIISRMILFAELVDINGDTCTTPTTPWLVFTAGAMGAGKGYTINNLGARGLFPLQGFVSVDPDEIRKCLPEYKLYLRENPSMAGELTKKESGYIAEILTLAALDTGMNVLVDGSLRDSEWYIKLFARLRTNYPALKIAILHVTAPREAVLERAKKRGEITGRKIPIEVLEMALEQVPKSILRLSPLADYFCEIDNPPDAEKVLFSTPEVTEESFQQNWLQTCAWVPRKRRKIDV
eukprot:CAMPEP_0194274028 /NCGR_PEP_ID=MMETSP0169-20130528/7218_1 /TAXON_ID=218684 /ORGANISM="Corethron pennatum, Strain L29A3" /LENGTH=380 /DNA_ID=CAMNT_0039017123 /DNA_START=257 /DNA_END=1399 /DNA_ORIENTATION=-